MPDDQRTKNDDAMAWVERWYATPDAQPSGSWDALLARSTPPPRPRCGTSPRSSRATTTYPPAIPAGRARPCSCPEPAWLACWPCSRRPGRHGKHN